MRRAAFLLAAACLALGSGAGAADDARAAFARPAGVPFPAENPYAPAKARLGKRLFFDTRLSGDGSRSCATCHDPAEAFQDALPRGAGNDGAPLARRTPALADLAWGERFFWDGRAATLEDQVAGPITAPREMHARLDEIVARLAADPDYPALFRAAFPEAPRVDAANLARAIATFERTIVTGESAFDRYVAGDEEAIGPDAKRGFALFTGKAGCVQCHAGWQMTDHAFYDVGLPQGAEADRGRGAVLNQTALDHAFKTPSLRNVAARAPYMHDGSLATLEDVVAHYADGLARRATLAPELATPIKLNAGERADLVAFLQTLDADVAPAPDLPAFVPAAGGAADAAPGRRTIVQRDKAFDARRIDIAAGESLDFVNDDLRPHNIRIADPKLAFDGGVQRPGETVLVRFTDPGTYHVVCGIHPAMKLDVTVR